VIEERCALLFSFRGFELACRLLALSTLGDDSHISNRHRHAVHGRLRRCRKDVARMNRTRACFMTFVVDSSGPSWLNAGSGKRIP
jgi:hypothetical protein